MIKNLLNTKMTCVIPIPPFYYPFFNKKIESSNHFQIIYSNVKGVRCVCLTTLTDINHHAVEELTARKWKPIIQVCEFI